MALGDRFLDQRDAERKRLAPIEAAGMFRAGLVLAPGRIEAQGGTGIALACLTIVRETEEIAAVIGRLRGGFRAQERDVAVAAASINEARAVGIRIGPWNGEASPR